MIDFSLSIFSFAYKLFPWMLLTAIFVWVGSSHLPCLCCIFIPNENRLNITKSKNWYTHMILKARNNCSQSLLENKINRFQQCLLGTLNNPIFFFQIVTNRVINKMCTLIYIRSSESISNKFPWFKQKTNPARISFG